PSTKMNLTCEGENKSVDGQVNGTGNGETTIPKGDLDTAFDNAEKVNTALTSTITQQDIDEAKKAGSKACDCKKVGDASAVKSKPKSCFSTVMGTAAYRDGDLANGELKPSIGIAKCGDFQGAADQAKKDLKTEKLGADGSDAFKSLGGDNPA